MVKEQLRPAIKTRAGKRARYMQSFDPYARLCSAMIVKAIKDYSNSFNKQFVSEEDKKYHKGKRREIRAFLLDEKNPFLLYLTAKGHEFDGILERVLYEIDNGNYRHSVDVL